MIEPANKETILRFYKYIWNCDVTKLTPQQTDTLNQAIEYWRGFFIGKSSSLLSMMTLVAEKMICSNGRFGPVTSEEKLYYYVKMVDPEFLFLEAYESGNTREKIRDLCIKNFRIYDPNLISLELRLSKVLKDIPDDLWSLDRIKK